VPSYAILPDNIVADLSLRIKNANILLITLPYNVQHARATTTLAQNARHFTFDRWRHERDHCRSVLRDSSTVQARTFSVRTLANVL
jgi:hypothetical protein